ncbi:uncharacterized protein LOC143226642 isoform X2 [Tachypleus tridentatus]|uniref:uncharacterized protein LOC143226642 isoform X2 n=1 Tax=Tachypleus tridentatus TaxID=6853 RepID=UPI003FD259D0
MVDPFKRRAGKNASVIMYPDLPSSITPVPHCSELPVSTLSERKQPSSEESSKSEEEVDVEDPHYNFRDAAVSFKSVPAVTCLEGIEMSHCEHSPGTSATKWLG